MRQYHVYIVASHSRCLYVGVTSDLRRRMAEHARGTPGSHTERYRITRLVYFEQGTGIRMAIAREKELDAWPRRRKLRLIEITNLAWLDMSLDWNGADSHFPS